MRTSPRRPLILKRRKLSMPVEDAAAASRRPATKGETDGRCSAVPSGQHPIDPGADPQKVPAGIKIMNHPTMPNTQVVFIPKHADIQSIIAALTAKGKECGSSGPNKFILISGGGTLHPSCPPETQGQTGQDAGFGVGGGARYTDCEDGRGVSHKDVEMEDLLLQTVKHLAPEPHSKQESENNSGAQSNCTLDESLTNIQWLGKMSSDGLGSCDVKQELENKENQAPEREFPREEDVDFNPSSSSFSAWQKSISERPPYSYMAMIQFAINSTERKRMTLKEIYTWIEDHFPYFKHVAKPGWKNSIRHNLSLHDMFVRETSANGKISFWTIHPDANRCLTLDQVFKPMDQDTQLHLLPCEPQQKRLLPELQKSVAGGSGLKSDIPGGIGAAERKMKLLLPRVNSYFVPFQFPLNQAFVQQPPGKASLNSVSSVSTTDLTKASKRVQIAPKTQTSKEETVALVEAPSTAIKEENEKSSFSCSKGTVSFTAFASPAWQIPGIQIPSEDNIAVKNKPPTAAIKEEFEVEVEVEEEEQEVEVAALAKLSCPRENILYTALKPPAWKMPDKQASMLKDGSSHIPPAKEPTSLAVKDSRFSVLRADVPLSSWKEDRTLYTSKSPARKIPDMQVIRRRKGGSRRKQHLAIPCAEEPLLFPECSNSDSGLVSDFSFLQETHALEPSTDFSCTQENFSFKTPIKEKFKLPASSTPSKPIGTAPPAGSSDPWRVTSLNKDADLPDFSPVRLPQGTTLTPLKDTLDLLAFSSPPFNDLPLFDSPQQLLNNKSPEVTSGPFTNSPTFEPLSAKRCAKELQIGSSTNRSLTEGLVLDTMNDSLSKILLDISFSGLEDDDDFERDNVSWSQFIPELR